MRRVVIAMHDKFHEEIHHFCVEANKTQKRVAFKHTFLPQDERKPFVTASVSAEQAIRDAFALKAKHRLGMDDVFVVLVEGNLYDDDDDEYFSVSNLDYDALLHECPGTCIVSLYYRNPESAFKKPLAEGLEKQKSEWAQLSERGQRRVSTDTLFLTILGVVTRQLTGIPEHEETTGCIMDYCQQPLIVIEAVRGGFHFCKQGCLPFLKRAGTKGRLALRLADRLTIHPHLTSDERKVFFSYAWKKNKVTVKRVERWLQEKGFILTRRDERDFVPGRKKEQEVKRLMAQCSTVIIFYSSEYRDRFLSGKSLIYYELPLARELRGEGNVKVIFYRLDGRRLFKEDEEYLAVNAWRKRNPERAYRELLRGILEVGSLVKEDAELTAACPNREKALRGILAS